ncbi:MAG: hypothetical protein MJ074_02160 [Oscillospiraceae bacterium]|nr:hypothetical protein [Oscillospiraceae bacterium]
MAKIIPGVNDLATTQPKLTELWDYQKNSKTPQEVSAGSGIIVWWKCSEGHSYQQAINKKALRNYGCPICSGHRTVAGVNDFATVYPEIAIEWHPTKKGDLLPTQLSKKNGKKVWWLCKYGHEWQATPHDRATDNTGCPICSQRRLTSFPEQAILYYIRKLYPNAINRFRDIFDNGMELDIYVPSIHFAVEFDGAAWHNNEEAHDREKIKYDICKKNQITLFRVKEYTGEEWKDVADTVYYCHKRKTETELQPIIQAIMDSIDPESNMWTRVNPRQIHSSVTVDIERDANEIREYLTPVPNSLSQLRPDLVKEWNAERNGKIKPEMFGINSNEIVWWKCSKCRHEWRTSIIHRGGKSNSGCPECSKQQRGTTFTKRRVTERGSLAEKNPALAAEWHPTKNGNLTPEDITEKRFAAAWWMCPKCGYEWQASPNNRSRGIGCPCCSGRVPKIGENDFQTLYPELAKDWNYEKNGELRPEQFLPRSGKKVWWRCSCCGCKWQTEIRNRTNGNKCPRYRAHPLEGQNDMFISEKNL